MVKSVVGEETRLKSLENRLFQSSVPAQVGLVVGKLNSNSDRGFVYDLIPTPPTDGGSPACALKSDGGDRKKGPSKGGKPSTEAPPSLSIDGGWVAEHARQVSRMLMGGINVVGVYIWGSENSFKATSPSVLAQIIRSVAQAAPWYGSEVDERLLIHISYSPSRWACRNCMMASGTLRPCDFKMGKLLASLQTFRCFYNFDIRLPICQGGAVDSNTFKNILHTGITDHAKELLGAKASIDGNLVSEDQQVSAEGLHNVELLLPFMEDAHAEACSSDEIAGLVVFSGTICACAYLGPKEPVSQAISDLKGDIISSLRSRLDIISDEAEDKVDFTGENGGEISGDVLVVKSIHQLILNEQRKPFSLSFPRRVLVPWSAGIFICDYLQPSETFEDVKDRCKEMLSMEAPIETSAIVELETEAVSVTAESFWDVIRGDSASLADESKIVKSSNSGDASWKSKPTNFNLLRAFLILLAAVIIGCALTVLGSRKNS